MSARQQQNIRTRPTCPPYAVSTATAEDEEGGGGGLTVQAGGSVPAVGTDTLILTDFIDTGSSVQTGGALTVINI